MKSGPELLTAAASLLAPLSREFVFLGGATVHLHVDDPAAADVRTTKDVDVVVAVVSYAEFAEVEAKLRSLDFEQSLDDDGAPICRWSKGGLLFDVMPTRPEYIGFSASEWFERGFDHSVEVEVGEGTRIRIFDVLHLLAAKVEAYRDRGNDDLFASQDFEDISTLLDGCTRVWSLLGEDSDAARFVRGWLLDLHQDDLASAIAGHLKSYARAEVLIQRLQTLEPHGEA